MWHPYPLGNSFILYFSYIQISGFLGLLYKSEEFSLLLDFRNKRQKRPLEYEICIKVSRYQWKALHKTQMAYKPYCPIAVNICWLRKFQKTNHVLILWNCSIQFKSHSMYVYFYERILLKSLYQTAIIVSLFF